MGRPVPSRRWVVAALLSTALVATLVAAACDGTAQGTAPAGSSPPGGAAASSPAPTPAGGAPTTSPASATTAEPSPTPTYAPLTALPPRASGRLTTTDADADGRPGSADYEFPTEQLAPDLTLDRRLAVKADGEGLRSALELTFENHGSGPATHAYVLEIPKEMAATIDDVTFSVPPTEVIDRDPKVKWNVDLGAAARIAIIATAFAARQDDGFVTGPVGLIFITKVTACSGIRDEVERAACTLDTVREFRDAAPLEKGLDTILAKWLPNNCQGLPTTQATAFFRAACLALLNGAGACAAVTDPGERALCHAYLAEADCELKKAGASRDRCLFERAVAGGGTFACDLMRGADAKALCEAAVLKSEDACRRLSMPEAAERCLAALAKGEPLTTALLAPAPVEDVDPDWFPVAKQNGPCRELGAGLSGWTMGKAKNRKPSQLDCWFETATPDRTKNIGILVLPSDADAQTRFAKCCSQSPPGSAVGGKTEGVEKELAWDGERFSRALGFVFAGLSGGAWVDGRWSDEYFVVERYRNCLIAIMTTIDYEAPPGKAPSPPVLSAGIDVQTAGIIEAAKKLIDQRLE